MRIARSCIGAGVRRGERRGISQADLEPPEEPAAGRAFASAGHEYALAVWKAMAELPKTAAREEASFVAYLVAAKTARLTLDLPLSDDNPARDHAAFNLLLIDTLVRQSHALIEVALGAQLDDPRFMRANDDLRHQLDHHLRSIRADDRRNLIEVIQRGRSPSPFCFISRANRASG